MRNIPVLSPIFTLVIQLIYFKQIQFRGKTINHLSGRNVHECTDASRKIVGLPTIENFKIYYHFLSFLNIIFLFLINHLVYIYFHYFQYEF